MEFVLKRTCPEDPQKEQVLMAALGCSRPMARALLQRGQDTPQKAAAFLEPSRIPLPDPYGLQDMDRAAALIREAVEQGRSIWVYGDYDADGVCATAILTRGLLGLGANVHWYIPSRHKEGYGMNKGAVRALKEQGAEMIVTVDNGIAAFEEIALARALGMEVVVTDHHRIQGDLPACGAVVCVSREEYRERVNDLCGAGVAYLLVKALWQQEPLELLPLAAVATAADIVDVTRENRGILYKGMSMVKGQTGFAALLRSAGAYQQPVTEITLTGVEGKAVSPLDFGIELDENGVPTEYSKLLTNQVAAGYNVEGGARGASGQGLSAGYVAVHPGEIPYGTKMYITSADNSFVYGFAVAADTGVGLMNDVIDVDLYYDTFLESCLNGKRNVNIYILD